jgi:hypothetical protein
MNTQHRQDLEKLQTSIKDTNLLKTSSKVLIGQTELIKLFYKLGDGESLIINSNGNMFKGKIKNMEDLTPLSEKLPGKTDNSLDGKARQEFIRTKPWVNAPGDAFKNAWNNQILKPPAKDTGNIHWQTFQLLLELCPVENIKMGRRHSKELKGILANDVYDIHFIVVDIIKDGEIKMSGYFSEKTGHLRYTEANGKTYFIE